MNTDIIILLVSFGVTGIVCGVLYYCKCRKNRESYIEIDV